MKYVNLEKIREVLLKISQKKQNIENTYFQTLTHFNEILKSDPNNKDLLIKISVRKKTLDDSVNKIIIYLENLTIALSNAFAQISNNQDLLDDGENQEYLITKPITPQDLDTQFEYEKELRNYKSSQSLDFSILEKEASEYDKISSVFDTVINEINKEFEYSAPKEVRNGLMNDSEYVFDDKLNLIETSLRNEIENNSVGTKFLEEQNKYLMDTLNKVATQNALTPQGKNLDSELYFSTLDKTVNAAVEKFGVASEKMSNAINVLSINQIESLEKLSLPLIKSLESTLKSLTQDLEVTRNENNYYRTQLDEYAKTIAVLQKENNLKENELKSSYDSWLSNSRRVSELEEIVNEQSNDIKSFYEEKNDIITMLEQKIVDTGKFINNIIYEKELLIEQNSNLFDEVNRLKQQVSGDLDGYINTISLQDLVEKEANKIVESKIQSLVNRYKEELEQIKSDSISYFLSVKDNDERIFEKLIEEKEQNQNDVSDAVKTLETKIQKLEAKWEYDAKLKQSTQDSLNDLNLLLGEGPYSMVEQEKTFLSSKFDKLEQRIEESLERVKTLEDEKEKAPKPKTFDESQLDDLILSSKIYGDITNQLVHKDFEIDALKSENFRIHQENLAISSVLDETIAKIASNSNKMSEIETLLTKQEYEFMMLDEEKNRVIDKLYNAINKQDATAVEQIDNLTILNKYDFSKFAKSTIDDYFQKNENSQVPRVDLLDYVKQEVAKVIDEEIDALKAQYEQKLKALDEKYDYTLLPKFRQPVIFSQQPFSKTITLDFPKIDDKYFDLEENLELKKDLQEYFESLKNTNEDIVVEEQIVDEDQETQEFDKPTLNYEYIGEQDNLLDVTFEKQLNPWEEKEQTPQVVKKAVNKIIKHTITNPKENELIFKLSNRNDDLENKIKNLQKIINDKFNQEIQKNREKIELTYNQPVVESAPIEFIAPDYAAIHKDLYSNQINQNQTINNNLQKMLVDFKVEQNQQLDNLNQKIDSINKNISETHISNESNWSVFENSLKENNNSLLEREIINSTNRLLNLEKELLVLETEIINEEKKVIVEL